jgi:DNA mismatch endonuclease (patch repair protein)
VPKTREVFWEAKFAANRARDLKVRADLARLDWRVAVVWECSLRKAPDVAAAAARVADWLFNSSGDLEF